MALVLANRVQESATANTTVSFTLTGSVAGFQSFAVIGDTNTTFYSATDGSGNWEVGLGTYSTTGPTLTRTTIYASSNSNNAVTFSGAVNVFVTYPSGRSVNLDASGNVSALGTIASGTWQGATVGVAYGGTGVTASSGVNSVVLRDANENITVNRVNQANTSTTAAGGTTALTAASSYIHTLVGTGGQTYTLPDATTLTTGVAFLFNNIATGTLTIQNYATGSIGTIASGGAGAVFLTDNSTTGGTWDLHAYLPEGVTFGTNAFNLGSAVISGGTWQGGTIQPAYGGTGLTSFTTNGAVYATGTTTLTSGTLPVIAGGTGATATPTNGQLLIGNGTNYSVASLGTGTGISATAGAGTLTINNTGVTSLAGTSPVTASASTGSVTVSLASNYGDTQNPYASKTANFFLAAPNGTAGAPTFRAIVAADIPTLNQNTTGSAGSVANAVTFNNGGTGDVSGTAFNGSAARTISYNTVGAPSTGGANASGTWGISISGSAATLTTGRTIGMTGDVSWTSASFNGSANVTGTATLANSGVTAATYTNATVTVDAKGRVTSASNGTSSAFAAGTAMMFVQTSAPTGWTKSTTHDNKALRVVSGTASSGGSVAFTTAFASQAVSGTVGVSLSSGGSVTLSAGGSVSNTTITTTTMPSHTHLNGLQRSNNSYGTGSSVGTLVGSTLLTGSTGSDGAHNHGFTNPTYSLTNPSYSGSFTGTAINLAVQYVDVIIATKD